ncbi:hypothetical protein IIA29_10690 [candidate division KSB1 bacterium]|nr:hypothetical protein [candidate division KSB1 bacterium]
MSESINWKNHFIELLVVIVGITAAFALNNWQENRKNSQKEALYIQSLIKDIESDIKTLEVSAKLVSDNLRAVKRLDYLIRHKRLTHDSTGHYAQVMFTMAKFTPQNTTYESLKSTGGFELITPFSLKKQISDLYISYHNITDVEKVFTDFLNQYIIPFFYEHVDFRTLGAMDPRLLRMTKFSNIVVGYLAVADQEKRAYEQSAEKCKTLLTNLHKQNP